MAHHLIIADCGLACANCGMCKCGNVHKEDEQIMTTEELEKYKQQMVRYQ